MHILGRFFQRTDGNYLYLHLFTLLGIMNSSTSTIIIYLNRSMLDITQSCRANRCVYKATHWCKRVPFIDSENKESFTKILNFRYISHETSNMEILLWKYLLHCSDVSSTNFKCYEKKNVDDFDINEKEICFVGVWRIWNFTEKWSSQSLGNRAIKCGQ